MVVLAVALPKKKTVSNLTYLARLIISLTSLASSFGRSQVNHLTLTLILTLTLTPSLTLTLTLNLTLTRSLTLTLT